MKKECYGIPEQNPGGITFFYFILCQLGGPSSARECAKAHSLLQKLKKIKLMLPVYIDFTQNIQNHGIGKFFIMIILYCKEKIKRKE